MSDADFEGRIASLTHRQRHFFCEKLTEVVYTRRVGAGDSAIDCGANIGHHSRILSKIVGEAGRIHAFEPNPDLFKGLVALGSNIRLWPFAAGDAFEICRLHIPEGLIGWASLEDIRGLLPEKTFKLVTTVQVRIDDLAELENETIRFIKIDVERRELQAMRGMRGLLTRDRPVVVFEGFSPGIRDFLDDAGFEVRDLLGRQIAGGRPIMANVIAVPRAEAEETLRQVLPDAAQLQEALDLTMAVVKG